MAKIGIDIAVSSNIHLYHMLFDLNKKLEISDNKKIIFTNSYNCLNREK